MPSYVYVIIFAVLFFSLCLAFIVFYSKHKKGNFKYSARIESDGGSIIMSKLLLEFGYWVITPLGKLLSFLKISPNAVTLFSLVLAAAAGYSFYKGQIALAGYIMAFSAIFDGIDGMLARLTNNQTPQGAALDTIVDRFSEMFVFMGVILYYKEYFPGLVLSVAALMGSLLVSYISAQGRIFSISLPRGLMRRGERAFYLSFASILSGSFNQLLDHQDHSKHLLVLIALLLIALLSFSSSIHRFVILFLTLKKNHNKEVK